jgi:O-acetylhomoserine/O-acetylserine sulfhydrylase
LSDEEKIASGVTEDLIRISVGTEHIDDIIADFEQSFAAAKEELGKAGHAENAETGSKAEHEVTVGV